MINQKHQTVSPPDAENTSAASPETIPGVAVATLAVAYAPRPTTLSFGVLSFDVPVELFEDAEGVIGAVYVEGVVYVEGAENPFAGTVIPAFLKPSRKFLNVSISCCCCGVTGKAV